MMYPNGDPVIVCTGKVAVCSLPSAMEDYVKDLLSDLDNKQNPVELHGIVRKLIASPQHLQLQALTVQMRQQ